MATLLSSEGVRCSFVYWFFGSVDVRRAQHEVLNLVKS